jgi:hypothetical protein
MVSRGRAASKKEIGLGIIGLGWASQSKRGIKVAPKILGVFKAYE